MEDAQKITQQSLQELHTARQQLVRLQSLTQLNQLISSSLHLDEVLREIAQATATLLEASVTSFWLAHAATRTLQFHSSSHKGAGAAWPVTELPFGQGGAGWVAVHRAVLNVPDVFADERIIGKDWFRTHGLRSSLLVPVILGDDLLAVLVLARAEPFHLDADDQYVLDNLSTQVAVAIRNARLYRASEEQRRHLATLVDVAQRLTRGLDLAPILQAIVEAAALVFTGEASVRLVDGNTLVRVAATPGAITSIPRERVRLGESLTGYVAVSHQPLIVADTAADERLFSDVRAALRDEWFTAFLCVPIRIEARILGTLQVYRERGYHFDHNALTMATSLADQAAIAIENARLFQEAQAHARQLVQANTALQGEIAERQRVEAARRRLEAQLRQAQKMEALGTLAGGIAHDFNNILAAILGYTELTLFNLPPSTTEWRNLQQVLIAGGRATRLVQQILAFSRQSEHKRQAVHLSLIVQETLALLRASLPSTIELQQSLAADSDVVLADPTQLQQVIINLCTNAEHAMRPTGGRLEVGLDSVDIDAAMATTMPELTPGLHVRLTIRDSGHGIMPEVQERIFDPFFTTKGPGEGTGMGLSVVHGIVTSYAGAITVDSTPGQGTSMAIYLPLFDSVSEETDHAEDAMARGHGSILFVDDEEALAGLGQEMLEHLGYVPEVYTSSRAALAAFQAAPQHFDLVITDQTMPDLAGDALTRALRQIRPDIPIILCTGFSHTMTAEKAAALGVDAFLMKPLVLQDLSLAIQHVMASRTTLEGTEPER